MTETQRRFLREIGARVGDQRVHEVRLFPPIKQAGIESGVAIVAALPLPPQTDVPPAAGMSDVEAPIPVVQDMAEPLIAFDAPRDPERYEIMAARYKLVLKGPERGTWEMDVRHEADAPLETIDRVVRGVALRAGEDGEPEHIAVQKFREALSDAPFVSDDVGAEYGAG
ncbi:MAG TPA: hypothetical protein VJ717_04120 [Gemmatimonadaceae bacterium]|nr:hypothetical protein [Gemmatimonadaceae bacterium]